MQKQSVRRKQAECFYLLYYSGNNQKINRYKAKIKKGERVLRGRNRKHRLSEPEKSVNENFRGKSDKTNDNYKNAEIISLCFCAIRKNQQKTKKNS